MKRVVLYCLALSLVACAVPTRPSSNTALKQGQNDSRLRRIADVPPGPRSYTLNCVSKLVCWVGDSLKQWRTEDGGQHWDLVYAGKQFESEIRTVDYVNERIAWLLTLRKVYKTEDGGRTWIEQVSPIPDDSQGEATSVTFLKDGKLGWITGGMYRPMTKQEQTAGAPRTISDLPNKTIVKPAIFSTEDAGKTWKAQSVPSNSGRVYGPTFVDEQRGLAIGDLGVFYTTNGGKQWKYVDFKKSCTDEKYLEGYDMKPLEVFFLDSRNAWLTFEDGRIAKSNDGGQSWCDLLGSDSVKFDYYEKYFKKIHFTDSLHGFGLGANRLIYETKDGGKTWNRVVDTPADDMFFLDNGTGFLVSKAGLFQIGL